MYIQLLVSSFVRDFVLKVWCGFRNRELRGHGTRQLSCHNILESQITLFIFNSRIIHGPSTVPCLSIYSVTGTVTWFVREKKVRKKYFSGISETSLETH